jgi:hypothetical protein
MFKEIYARVYGGIGTCVYLHKKYFLYVLFYGKIIRLVLRNHFKFPIMQQTKITIEIIADQIFQSAWDTCLREFKNGSTEDYKVTVDLAHSEGLVLDEDQILQVCIHFFSNGDSVRTEDNFICLVPAIKSVRYNLEAIELEFNPASLEREILKTKKA